MGICWDDELADYVISVTIDDVPPDETVQTLVAKVVAVRNEVLPAVPGATRRQVEVGVFTDENSRLVVALVFRRPLRQ